jgi:hypothetical protein
MTAPSTRPVTIDDLAEILTTETFGTGCDAVDLTHETAAEIVERVLAHLDDRIPVGQPVIYNDGINSGPEVDLDVIANDGLMADPIARAKARARKVTR